MLNETKTIDKNIPVPLYYQLKELILEAINENKYTAGDVIPTEKEISSYYQISRTTVRQAIGELVQEGILYRVKSKGTFVAEPKIKQEYISKIQSFNDEILHRGMTPSKERLYSILDISDETRIHHLDRTIEAVEAGTEDAKLLEMEKKKPIQYIRSVGYNSFGKVIEYTMSRYRGDRNQFTVTVFHEVN